MNHWEHWFNHRRPYRTENPYQFEFWYVERIFVPNYGPRSVPTKMRTKIPYHLPFRTNSYRRYGRSGDPIVAMRFISIKSQLADLKPCRHICSIWMPFFVVDSVLIWYFRLEILIEVILIKITISSWLFLLWPKTGFK